jgi:cytochrome c5
MKIVCQLVSVVTVLLALMACGDNAGRVVKNLVPVADRLPGDAALAEIYQRSCKNCHAVSGSQAPITGEAAWQSRMAKGMDTLLDNTINGYNGMPPLGMCFDCDEQQFRDLINFMAAPAEVLP